VNTNKILPTLILTGISALLSGCFQEEIDSRQTEEIAGLVYKLRSNEPFTGLVKNYPMTFGDIFSLGACSMPIKNGLPDGTTECFANDELKVAEINFKEGKKDGKETIWNHKTQKIQEESEWKSGRKHGEQKKYNPESGKLIRLAEMSEGKLNGIEKEWAPDGEMLRTDLVWKNGKQSGKSTVANRVEHFLDGKLHGEQTFFDLGALQSNGTYATYMKATSNYKNGDKTTEKQYDELGNLTFEQHWKKGVKQYVLSQKWKDGKIVERSNQLNSDPTWSDRWKEPPMIKDGEEKYFSSFNEYHHVTWDMGRPLSGSYSYFGGDGKPVFEYQGVPSPDGKTLLKNGTEFYMYSSASAIKKLEWKNGQLNEPIPSYASPDFFNKSGCSDCLKRAINDIEYSRQQASSKGEDCYTDKVAEVHEENPNFAISFDMMNEIRAECGLTPEE
jgi:antitoxin component YwqK of YwqJK toxin-antitoxin module